MSLPPAADGRTRDPARPPEPDRSRLDPFSLRGHRRAFLGWSGVAAAGLVIAACGDDDEEAANTGTTDTQAGEADVTLDFGKDGDIAVVNFAYALEQLEAAFYSQATDNLYSGASDDEQQVLEDLKAHEIAHRDFFKAVLGDNAIPALQVDFSNVDFSSRESVLQTAQTFEDLGVSAYNGAASLISGDGPLGLAPLKAAGEIVSVEARHASVIRQLVGGDDQVAFAPDAFDEARPPQEVLEAANPFIKTNIALANVPRASQ